MSGRGHVVDETGNEYHAVSVIRRAHNGKNGAAQWLCRCKICGGTRSIPGVQLRADPPKMCMGRCGVAEREAAGEAIKAELIGSGW
jgi:hypothetical protein